MDMSKEPAANGRSEFSTAKEANVKNMGVPHFRHKKTTSCHKTTLGTPLTMVE